MEENIAGLQNNVKYRQILVTAKELFFKYGIRRVTIEEICKKAGVSKMTFYKFFQNKIELAIVMLKQLYDSAEEDFDKITNSNVPFTEKVKMTIEMKKKQTEYMGLELWADMLHNPIPEVEEYIEKQKMYFIKKILNIYTEAQKTGDIRPDIKPEFILYILNLLMETAKDENLLKLYDTPKALAEEVIKFYFYGIVTRKEY